MNKSRPRKHNYLEAKIRDYIAIAGYGITEVKTPVGKIDVLFPERKIIVEIKKISGWKGAIGQLQCYQNSKVEFLDYKKHLLLFGQPNLNPYLYEEVSQKLLLEMRKICRQNLISLEFFPKDNLIDLACNQRILLI